MWSFHERLFEVGQHEKPQGPGWVVALANGHVFMRDISHHKEMTLTLATCRHPPCAVEVTRRKGGSATNLGRRCFIREPGQACESHNRGRPYLAGGDGAR